MDTLDQAVAALAPAVGTVRACRAVGQPRSSWYRRHRQSPPPPRPPRPAPVPQPRALQAAERQQVLEVLHAERFWDQAPASVYATLLDEGVYLASVSTMDRLLRARGETGDRRRHATHPARVKPELLASGPTSAGRGTSPSWPGRPSGPGTTCTCSWTSTAATSSAGWSPPARPRRWPSGCWPTRSPRSGSRLASSPCMPTVSM
jgi:hypothetical protein